MFPTDAKAYSELKIFWGEETARKILVAAFTAVPTAEVETFDDFLKHCTACGGDWGQMFLTGIKALWPSVYDAIPDYMGVDVLAALTCVLILCDIEI